MKSAYSNWKNHPILIVRIILFVGIGLVVIPTDMQV